MRDTHPEAHRRIHGVDFSGATDAGRRIWIASGLVQGGRLRIAECRPAEELPGSGRDRARCLAALREFIARGRDSAFGLDYPFGLPRVLVTEESWEDFVLWFPRRYATPEAFRRACRAAARGAELRRVTDRESRTPFSPYNLRLYRQTYFGIRDLLFPLVRDRLACVPPMQRLRPRRPWVFEICPASLLKREQLYLPYKGRSEGRRAARARILARMEARVPLSFATSALRSAVTRDPYGDALDSVIAAWGAFRALRQPPPPLSSAYALEGYVYV